MALYFILNDNKHMNKIKIQHIDNLEAMTDQALSESLKCMESHQIGNVNWQEFPYKPSVNFRMAYSDKALAIMFEVTEDHVKAAAMEHNGPVWEDSCVEFFVMSPDGVHYTNFEMNCAGTMLAARRTSRHDPEPFGSDKMAEIRRITSLPHQPVNIKGEGQQWWAIEVIPFKSMGFDQTPETLRANLYKCGDNCEKAHFLSWSPITLPKPDFHCPDFFGEIIL